MSDTRSQLEEVDALIAAAPDDPSLVQLRDDLLQLIALEEEEESAVAESAPPSGYDEVDQGQAQEQQEGHLHADSGNAAAASASEEQTSAAYTAQGTFMEHIVSKEAAVAEAPDLGSFHAVVRSSNGKSAAKSQPALKTGETTSTDTSAANLKDDSTDNSNTNNTTDITQQQSPSTTSQPEKQKKKKKKKKSDDAAVLEAKFELPSHLVPLESDTSAQKLKKHRTAKALKSKFRAKQKEAEHAKKQNDWKSFATKGKKKRKGVVGGGSMFSTEEGVNARVGVISGGGGRKMTGFADPNKRHKFT